MTIHQILTASYFDEINDYAIIVLILLSFISYLYLKRLIKRSGDMHFYKIKTVADETGNIYFNYISIYLLSCLGLSLNNIVDVFVLTFLMCLVGFIYINNQMTYMNPVMQFIVYKIYECELYSCSTEKTLSSIVIAPKDVLIKKNERYGGTGKQDFVYLEDIQGDQ